MIRIRSAGAWLFVVALWSVTLSAEVASEKINSGDVAVVKSSSLDWSSDQATYKKLVIDLADPSMEGRGPGTQGIDKARDYLVSELKKIGLEPAFKSAKGEKSFLQEFEISAGIAAKEQELVLLDKAGKVILEPKLNEHFSARGFSGDGKASATLVFIGYGISDPHGAYDSFKTLEKDALKGKVAVAYRYEPVDEEGRPTLIEGAKAGQWGQASSLINKANWAAKHGAAALLVVDPPSQDAGGSMPSVAATQGSAATIPVIQIKPEIFRMMLRSNHLGDVSTAKQWEKEANAGETKVHVLSSVQAKLTVNMERVKATVHNIAGVLPGAGKLKDEYIVIGGHYDHLGFGDMGSLARDGLRQIHHGADDNASGTAGVIISAVALAQAAKASDAPQDRRTILFALFTGEERGLLGSAYMLRKPEEMGIKLEQIDFMLNMDMTGRMNGNKLIASGSGSGEQFEAIMAQAAKPLNLHVASSSGMGIGGSDHQSFHAKSIPAVHFFTGIHPDYHKPSDTADKINVEGGVKSAHLVTSIVMSQWGASERIKFQAVRMAHPAAGGPRGGGAYLGIVPNYASMDATDGCLIDGTSNGSPAAAAGLKPDDKITSWNGKAVKNLQDLTNMLRDSKAGDEITVGLQRSGKPVEIKIKLGTRG